MNIKSHDFTSPTAAPIKQPSFFRRYRVIVIVLISIVCLFAAAIAASIVIATTTFVGVRNVCVEKDSHLQEVANSLESHLKNISIDNHPPSAVKTGKNGDCLTGTGAFAVASFFNFSYSNTVEANAGVARSLNSVSPQDSQSFILGDYDGDSLVEFIQTKLISGTNHATYDVKYYLIDPIACPDHGYESSTCVKGETSEDMQGYMRKPINKIELSAYGA
jgi:hypothetical protein